MTTEEFIQKAKAIHGDKYDYSKVEYVRQDAKVCIKGYIHCIYRSYEDARLARLWQAVNCLQSF